MSRYLSLIALVLVLASCSEYQKVLKSNDLELKFEKAVEYYEAEEYNKAYPLFDELLTLYRGTEKAADVYYYYAYTNFHLEDFILAAYHFKNFNNSFPGNEKAVEAAYMAGYCYYLESPRPSLDQTYTYKAINELQLFANTYSTSDRIYRVNELIDDLREKLEQKSFDRAELYFNLENYQAAVASFNNTLSEYPDTKYRERAHYLRLVAAFRFADKSIREKQRQRFIEARTAYNEYMAKFPEGQYAAEVADYGKKIRIALNELKIKPVADGS